MNPLKSNKSFEMHKIGPNCCTKCNTIRSLLESGEINNHTRGGLPFRASFLRFEVEKGLRAALDSLHLGSITVSLFTIHYLRTPSAIDWLIFKYEQVGSIWENLPLLIKFGFHILAPSYKVWFSHFWKSNFSWFVWSLGPDREDKFIPCTPFILFTYLHMFHLTS